MGRLIYMNTTLALLDQETIEQLFFKNKVIHLEDSFYLVINEEITD